MRTLAGTHCRGPDLQSGPQRLVADKRRRFPFGRSQRKKQDGEEARPGGQTFQLQKWVGMLVKLFTSGWDSNPANTLPGALTHMAGT